MPVLEANLLRCKGDAASHYQAGFPLSEQRQPSDGMCSGVVRVDDVGSPFAGNSAELSRRSDVPLAAEGQPISGEARVLCAADERRAGRCDDERAIAEVAEAGGKEKYLALAATPAAPGIDVKNPG